MADRDNRMVRVLRRRSPDQRATLAFYLEHSREWGRLLNRLTSPNRIWLAQQTRGMDAGAFAGHSQGPHDCYLDD